MKTRPDTFLAILYLVLFTVPAFGGDRTPSSYGNILIDRQSTANGMKPATFSHWIHRLYFTCRVCHLELEFAMEANTTEITEEDNLDGEYCGACHNGDTAFGHNDDTCLLCHNGDNDYSWNKFDRVEWMESREFGNGVDWSQAALDGDLQPKQSIYGDGKFKEVEFDKKFEIDADMGLIPSSDFSHEAHTFWLDCANCHPDIFEIKKGTTTNLTMRSIRKGKYCGHCHGKVASPIEDCEQCHRGMGKKM